MYWNKSPKYGLSQLWANYKILTLFVWGGLSWKTTQVLITIDLFLIEPTENRLELFQLLTDCFVWDVIC